MGACIRKSSAVEVSHCVETPKPDRKTAASSSPATSGSTLDSVVPKEDSAVREVRPKSPASSVSTVSWDLDDDGAPSKPAPVTEPAPVPVSGKSPAPPARRASLSDIAAQGVSFVKRRGSLQEMSAALSNISVAGFSNAPDAGGAPPCEKKFNAFFFKPPTASMAERGLMPPPNPSEKLAKVQYKRLLYESNTTFFTLFAFRDQYWVGMRPKKTLQEIEKKRASTGVEGDQASRRGGGVEKLSWETMARRYIFTRVSKILEKNPTARIECICNTVTSEMWGVRGLSITHPLVTDASLTVSLENNPKFFKPDDLPWVTDIPHMMDVGRPVESRKSKALDTRKSIAGLDKSVRRRST